MAKYVFTAQNVNDLAAMYQQNAEAVINAALFTLGLRIFARLAELTPVRTGYLRLSLTTAVNGETAEYAPPDRDPKAAPNAYASEWPDSEAAAYDTLLNFKAGTYATFGYTAEYAPYVEDKVHMVKTVQAEMDGMIRDVRRDVLP